MQSMSGFWFILMTVVSILVKANCQCSVDETRNSEVSQPCNQIYAALESALVSTDNLYVLRTVLYPSSELSPTLLEVEYNIQLPDNGTFTTTLGWTDSGVFAAINPETLFNLQLRILYWPLRNLVLEPDTITLTLDARNNEVLSNATFSDIIDVLDILNARLLVYATEQEALTDWNGRYIGYTWDVQNGNDGLLIGVVIVTTPIALVIFVALFAALRGVLDESDSISVFKFLYGLEVPALILIFVEFVTSFIQWVDCQRFACIVKEYTVIAIFIFAILFTAYSIMFAKDKACNSNFLHLFLSNFVFLKALIALTSISSVPLILLIVVYPAEILCTIIIYLSAITLFAVLLSPLSVYAATKDSSSVESREDTQGNDEPDAGELTESQDESATLIPPEQMNIWNKFLKICEKVKVILEKHRITLTVLAVFLNVSLAAMLLSLLYMQALLAGATSNVVVNFILVIVTALIPGGLVYGTGKAIRKRFRPGEQVFLMAKSEHLNPGQYKVISRVDKENYLVRGNGNEGIVKVSALLNEKETPQKVIGFCTKESINPGDKVILKTDMKKEGFHVGQKCEVLAKVSEESSSYLIENSQGQRNIVDVSDLIKIRFARNEKVFLITKYKKLDRGEYTVVGEEIYGHDLRYRIKMVIKKEGQEDEVIEEPVEGDVLIKAVRPPEKASTAVYDFLSEQSKPVPVVVSHQSTAPQQSQVASGQVSVGIEALESPLTQHTSESQD